MSMTSGQRRASWTVGIMAGAGTIAVSMFTLWGNIGWTTPNRHDADFLVAIDQVKEFRDEWKCDEYDEELLDLLREQVENDSVELRRQIEKIKEKMARLDCSRFEDFG